MRIGRQLAAVAVGAVTVVACSSGRVVPTVAPTVSPAVVTVPTTTAPDVTLLATTVPETTIAETTEPPTTVPATTLPETTVPKTTVPPETTALPETTAVAATSAGSTPYGMPVADGAHASYSHQHHDYPASDVFVPEGCGSALVSPVNGVVLEARRVDNWTSAIDNPATRGGKSVAILGDDGVRYYLAHFNAIDPAIEPGNRVVIGQALGQMGRTGRAGACHVHVAISPPCPGPEWSVRRGVIWPWRYLDAWRHGEQLSPVAEVEQWLADHPDACAQAMADPNAGDS